MYEGSGLGRVEAQQGLMPIRIRMQSPRSTTPGVGRRTGSEPLRLLLRCVYFGRSTSYRDVCSGEEQNLVREEGRGSKPGLFREQRTQSSPNTPLQPMGFLPAYDGVGGGETEPSCVFLP